MKSTLIFSMLCHNTNIVQTVENSSDCSHAHTYIYYWNIYFLVFHQTSQCNICTADIFTLAWTKICLQSNKLKNKIAERNCDHARGCTLCPASHSVSPWLMTSSAHAALISFGSCLLWPWPPLPALPLTLLLSHSHSPFSSSSLCNVFHCSCGKKKKSLPVFF